MEAKVGPLKIEKKKKRFTSIEMKFFGGKAGCALFDHKRSEEILEEFKVKSVV